MTNTDLTAIDSTDLETVAGGQSVDVPQRDHRGNPVGAASGNSGLWGGATAGTPPGATIRHPSGNPGKTIYRPTPTFPQLIGK